MSCADMNDHHHHAPETMEPMPPRAQTEYDADVKVGDPARRARMIPHLARFVP
jgi:hypothetical protein